MRTLDGDQAVFYQIKNDTLIGMIGVHVDDLLLTGTEDFHSDITDVLEDRFKFTKMKTNEFNHIWSINSTQRDVKK